MYVIGMKCNIRTGQGNMTWFGGRHSRGRSSGDSTFLLVGG